MVASNLDLIALARVKLGEIYAASKEYQKALREIAFVERNKEEIGFELLDRTYTLLATIPVTVERRGTGEKGVRREGEVRE
jgi:hypothetical protein